MRQHACSQEPCLAFGDGTINARFGIAGAEIAAMEPEGRRTAVIDFAGSSEVAA
jgi:hypothetical protein